MTNKSYSIPKCVKCESDRWIPELRCDCGEIEVKN